MARQAGEEGRIASVEEFVRQFLETAVGATKATVAGRFLRKLRRPWCLTMRRPVFVSRYDYPPPLEVVVRISVWASLRWRFVGLWEGVMHDPANGVRRISLLRSRVNRTPRVSVYMDPIPGAIPLSKDVANSTTPPATMTTPKGRAMR